MLKANGIQVERTKKLKDCLLADKVSWPPQWLWQNCSLQHPQDPALPHTRSSTDIGPSARHHPPRPQQHSLLAVLPASTIKPLQRIQNTAARLVFNLPKFSHVTPPSPPVPHSTVLQGCQWNCPRLPPSICHTPWPKTTSLCSILY